VETSKVLLAEAVVEGFLMYIFEIVRVTVDDA
jgi:hypothetical protein